MTDEPRGDDGPNRRRRTRPSMLRRIRFLPVALACAAAAGWGWLETQRPARPVRFIEAVRVTKPTGAKIDASTIFGGNDAHDYYVRIELTNDVARELETYDDTLIGNGLIWDLDIPIAFNAINEVSLWDDRLLRDACLDRVAIGEDLTATGQTYQFELIEESPTDGRIDPRILWGVISGAGVLALVTAVLFVRDQAVP